MASLGDVEIRYPQRRTVAGYHLGEHASAMAAADEVDHHLIVLQALRRGTFRRPCTA
jgi:hypothetical protein